MAWWKFWDRRSGDRRSGAQPACAIYVDKSKSGMYSARLVRADDPGIGKGKPSGVLLSPVRARYGTPIESVQDMARRLRSLGFGDGVHLMEAHVEGETSTKSGG